MLTNFNLKAIGLISASVLLLSGCASITGDSMQNIMVEARDQKGAPLSGVKCKLANDKGTWNITTPGTVMVHKSAGDLQIVSEKQGHQPGMARVVSKANGGMAGNILFGGAIGAVIDHSKGTAYNYPQNVVMVMGESQVLPTKTKKQR